MMNEFLDAELRSWVNSMDKGVDAMNKSTGEKFVATFEKATFNQEFTDMVKKLKEDIALSLIDKLPRFRIRRVVFNEPATIVFWEDGTKTVVKCQEEDVFMPETGIALCYMKKLFNNKGNYNEILKKWSEQFHEEETEVDIQKALTDGISNLIHIFVQHTKKPYIFISDDFKKQLFESLDNAIKVTDMDDGYSRGFRNGLRYAKSLIDGKDPIFEECMVEGNDGKEDINECSEINTSNEEETTSGTDVSGGLETVD